MATWSLWFSQPRLIQRLPVRGLVQDGEMCRCTSEEYEKQQNPRTDWIMIRYTSSNSRKRKLTDHNQGYNIGYPDPILRQAKCDYAPGCIKAILSTAPDRSTISVDNVWLVVETCEFNNRKSSVFTTTWKAAVAHDGSQSLPYRELISPQEIVRHCLMIPKDSQNKYYEELWPIETWEDQFL